MTAFVDPEVLQSGFGVIFSGLSSFRTIAGEFVSEFLQDFKPPKIHAQNCRHSSLISDFYPKYFLFTGETNLCQQFAPACPLTRLALKRVHTSLTSALFISEDV